MMDMEDGDIVPMTNFTTRMKGFEASYNAPGKGKAFMFLLLGVAERNDLLAFDAEKALNDLGWFRAPAQGEGET